MRNWQVTLPYIVLNYHNNHLFLKASMYVFIYFFYQDAKLSEAWKSKMHPFLSKFSSDKSWVTLTRYKNFHALFIFLELQSQSTNVYILQQCLDNLKIYSSLIRFSVLLVFLLKLWQNKNGQIFIWHARQNDVLFQLAADKKTTFCQAWQTNIWHFLFS